MAKAKGMKRAPKRTGAGTPRTGRPPRVQRTSAQPQLVAQPVVTPPAPTGNPLSSYLTIACAGTGQSTFYNTRQEQELALETAHSRLLTHDRRIYALTAALPLNDRSRQLLAFNLLGNGKTTQDPPLEGAILGMIMDDMQFNRVLNLMVELRDHRVNCARVRKLGQYLWSQVDEFRAIKYASKLRTLIRHCHIPDGKDKDPARGELWHFVTGNIDKLEQIQHSPKLRARFRARTEYEALFQLPLDIARDMAVAFHKKSPEEFEREFVGTGKTKDQKGKGATTRKETMIARQKSVKGETVPERQTDIDFSRFSLTELLQHGYRNPAEQIGLGRYIEQRAADLAQGISLPAKVALVIDNSRSMLGSQERLHWPLVVVSSIISVFRHSGSALSEHYTGAPVGSNYFLQAGGDSCLRRPLVEALLTRPDALVILSDGYENVAAGSVSQILHSRAVLDTDIHVIHLNPVIAAESGKSIRQLANNLNAYALSSIEQMGAIAMLALADRDPHALDHMFGQIETALRAGDFRLAKSIGHKLLIPALEAAG